jgi:anti-anti-sigma factor
MGSSPTPFNLVTSSDPEPGPEWPLDELVPFGPDPQHQRILMPQLFSVSQGVQLKQRVQQFCLQQTLPKRLVLDFQQTHFMDSSGVGSLIACRRLLLERQAELVLQRLSPQVRMVLQLTELDQVFTIEQGEADLRALGPSIDSADIVTHPSVHSKAKRLLDIVGALVGLGITAIAALPIIIAIKLEDGGPIFFGQMRCSWLGKPFRIWKFRSMVIDAEARKAEVKNELQGALFKNARDHRITAIGRFLRRTSLDELPQFWNVLCGEMSLVGTRPPTLEETEQYEIPQWRRLDIKPGMTGEWQVNGRSTVKTFEDVVQLDLKYQRNWSLWYDIKLILKTIAMVFTKRSGAV